MTALNKLITYIQDMTVPNNKTVIRLCIQVVEEEWQNSGEQLITNFSDWFEYILKTQEVNRND